MHARWMRLLAAILATAGSVTSTSLLAQTSSSYPSKPIKMVVPFPAGAAATVGGRLIADALGRNLDQSVIIENKPGAGGRVGAALVAREAGDGYTLLYTLVDSIVIAPLLETKLGFDPEKDFRPVALMVTAPNLLVVRKSFPAKTFAEFVAYAKEHPGKINFGIQGIGTQPHASLEKLRRQARVEITAVAYPGGAQAITDMVAERLDAMFLLPAAIKELLETGQLRALATLEPKRVRDFPNIPSVSELGFPKLVDNSSFGFFAPRETPDPVIDKLVKALLALHADAALAQRLQTLGYGFEPIGPAEFSTLLAKQRKEFAEIAAGGRLDKPN